MLVGGLSRGVRGGQTSGLSGVVCHTYLLATQLGPQFTLYFYSAVGLFVRYVTPNSGVKSEKHFHLELIHSAAKERSPALAPGLVIGTRHNLEN